jgi:ribosomal protein S18 acetylase RimI-like enzyme
MNFRQATKNDLPILNQISIQSKRHWGYPEEWIAKWEHDMMVAEKDLVAQTIIVAMAGGVVAGFCAVVEQKENYEVTHLWILPEYMGQGLGKQLLEVSLESIIKASKPIIVESDPNAEAFYEKQGFITYDKIESYPPGRFLPVMRKNN